MSKDSSKWQPIDTGGEPQKIYGLLAKVQKDLSETGVAKGAKNREQNYMFRKYDDVQKALSAALARHGVFGPAPEVTRIEEEKIQTRKGGTMTRTKVFGRVVFYADDGSSASIPGVGEAADSGDKSVGKATTYMVKSVVLHSFCVPLEGVADPDSESHETVSGLEPEEIEQLNKVLDKSPDVDSVMNRIRQTYQVSNIGQIPREKFKKVIEQATNFIDAQIAKREEAA